LIRACQIANLSLLVVGDGPEMENLKKLSKELDASVLFLGQVGKEASIASIRRAKIFALLSAYEGLSFSLIEAMMLKKRILVSNAAGNLEVIRDGIDGIVLNDMNPRNVAKKLIQLCDDSSTSIFQENCYAQAIDRYCLETQLDEMIELILRD
jgi:glycosyltransferase involved in cell wall biosynthesis